ncbi:MAG: hypothetical protein HFE75_15285 [Firmicutes bacterium]|nr:hypothetical protein [Bacillota bacterium]NBI61683.1 hypothetical protein [Clostridiales bacterium]
MKFQRSFLIFLRFGAKELNITQNRSLFGTHIYAKICVGYNKDYARAICYGIVLEEECARLFLTVVPGEDMIELSIQKGQKAEFMSMPQGAEF